MVRTKFYWSWARGPVLILRTAIMYALDGVKIVFFTQKNVNVLPLLRRIYMIKLIFFFKFASTFSSAAVSDTSLTVYTPIELLSNI